MYGKQGLHFCPWLALAFVFAAGCIALDRPPELTRAVPSADAALEAGSAGARDAAVRTVEAAVAVDVGGRIDIAQNEADAAVDAAVDAAGRVVDAINRPADVIVQFRDAGPVLLRDMADAAGFVDQFVDQGGQDRPDPETDVAPDGPPVPMVDAPLDADPFPGPDLAIDTRPADAPLLGSGNACASGNQCVSGICADGVCCLSDCSGTCRACNVASALGTCTLISDGLDPADECGQDLPTTCGSIGSCNGAGACRVHQSGTACRAVQCNPTTAVVTAAMVCDGNGTCPATTPTPCAPWGCNGTACATSCSPSMPCAPGYSCYDSACVSNTGPLLLPRFEAYSVPADLTQLGTVDWAHYGHVTTYPYVSKHAAPLGGLSYITMSFVGGATEASGYGDRAPRFSWTNGTPTLVAANVADGIFVPNANRGFRITLNASSTTLRTVRLWLGAWGARGKLTAQLTDNSLPVYTDNTLASTDPGLDRVYTIGFRAQATGQSLVIEWVAESVSDPSGNVTLQAVTVSQ